LPRGAAGFRRINTQAGVRAKWRHLVGETRRDEPLANLRARKLLMKNANLPSVSQ